jgi:SAM-dependent methyltransferase
MAEHEQMPVPEDDHSLQADDETDSAYAESLATDTTSLSSWIADYREENGRAYHRYKDGSYYGAVDEAALEHMDICHALYTRTYGGKLFLAPIDTNPTNILDLGTGTSIWAIDVAEQYPSAIVLGTDLAPSQPAWVPPNCKFQVDDMEADFCWPDNHFDFIHIRGLHGTIRNWPRLYQQCLRVLKPGGYIEHAEYSAMFTTDDNTIPPDGGIAAWNAVGPECHAVLKTELQVLDKIGDEMNDAGFENIQQYCFKWPVGSWPKRKDLKQLGRLVYAHIDTGLENWTLRLLTSVLGWRPEEVYVLCANVRQDFRNQKVHAIHKMCVGYGRKPASGPSR